MLHMAGADQKKAEPLNQTLCCLGGCMPTGFACEGRAPPTVQPLVLLGRGNDLQEVWLQRGAAYKEAIDVLAGGELIRI